MLAIPLRLYRAQYEIGDEREFFELDSLLLRAIGEEGLRTVSSLENAFGIHRRLLIGSLLDLFEDGWIALMQRGSGIFALTPKGRHWLASKRKSLPPRTEPRRDSFYFYQEQITGGLIGKNEVETISENQLPTFKGALLLPEEIAGSWLDSGAVRKLIGRTNLLSLEDPVQVGGLFFLLTDPDLPDRRVLALPPVWKQRLERRLLQEASMHREYHGKKNRVKSTHSSSNDEGYRTTIRNDDIVLGEKAHRELLRSLLANAAKDHTILICSPDASAKHVTGELGAALLQALSRGANVTVLWNCHSKQEGTNVAAALRKIRMAAQNQPQVGTFQFNETALSHQVSLLISGYSKRARTKEAGNFMTVIGNFAWLGKQTGEPENGDQTPYIVSDAGIRIHHPHLIGQLAGLAATFLAAMSRKSQVSNLVNAQFYWRDISLLLNRQPIPDLIQETDACIADLWVVREYECLAIVADEVVTCEGQSLIVSPQADEKGLAFWRNALSGSSIPMPVMICGESEGSRLDDHLRVRSGIHACVVAGKGAYIGSTPPLCGVPPDLEGKFGIGVRIDNGRISEILRQAFIPPAPSVQQISSRSSEPIL
jgi:hypothetical protein